MVATITQAGGSAVIGADVIARAVWPDSTISVVLLADDGLAPDSVADDGNYSGVLEANQAAGSVSVEIAASGASPALFFRRHQFAFRNGVYADVSIGGSGLVLQISNFLAGSPVAARAEIINAGPWSGNFAVALTDLSVDALVKADTLFVAAGGAVEYSAIYTPLSDGLHRMKIEARPVGEVVDLATQGNRSEVELVIGDLVAGIPGGGGDLQLQDNPVHEVTRWAAIQRADPNPFNPVINIAFWVGKIAQVALDVYDLRGRLVCSLLRDDSFQGDGSVQWNGRDRDGARIGSGVYLIRLRANDFVDVRKIVMLE